MNYPLWIALSFLHFAAIAQPTISSFSPVSASTGTTVTITGSNFSSIASDNIVYFGATTAAVLAASTTSLTVTVPVGALYQEISVTDITTNLTGFSAQPFIPVFSCGNAIDSASFSTPTWLAADSWPTDASIGDLDGDGRPDLAIAYLNGYSISVFRNASTGSAFSFAKIDYPIAGQISTSFADIDGDGKLDLVTSDQYSTSVHRNTSTGSSISFAAYVTFGGGGQISIADIDKDGKTDVTCITSSDSVGVLRNVSAPGIISFAPATSFMTGQNARWTISTDLDGDGLADIATCNYIDSTISVLRNTSTPGSISFATKTDLPVDLAAASLAAGDLDMDGKPDLVVSNYYYYKISTLRNTGTPGNISFAGKTDILLPARPNGIAIADLNGDVLPEIIIAPMDFYISVLNNNSSAGTILLGSPIDFMTGVGFPYTVSAGDLNADGKPELIVPNTDDISFGGTTLSILKDLQCSSTTAIPEQENAGTASIYPNPFSASATLVFKEEIRNSTVSIIDVLGRKLRTIPFSGTKLIINRDGLPSGIYFIEVTRDQRKIIKQKMVIE